MRRSLPLALLAALLLAAPSAHAAKPAYQAGAAKVLANPPEGQRLCLGGYGACPNGRGRTMTGIGDDLYARALAISSGDDGLVLVTTTYIGLFAAYKTDGLGIYHLRQEVARRTGLRADHVIVQSDHSHAGPDTIGIWGGVPTSYLEQLQAAAVESGVQAWRARRPASIRVGTADGTGVTSSYDEEGHTATDDEFRLLFASDE